MYMYVRRSSVAGMFVCVCVGVSVYVNVYVHV